MDVDVVVADLELALDEIPIVQVEEDGGIDPVAGEAPHVVHGLEEEDRLELRVPGTHAAENERAAATRDLAGVPHARLLEVRRIRLAVLRERGTAPDPCDHSAPARYFVSQPDGSYALPCEPAPIESTTVPSAVACATRSAFGSSTHTKVTAGA